jgi:hypothetical protein
VILSDLHNIFQIVAGKRIKRRYFGCREPKASLPLVSGPEEKSGQRNPKSADRRVTVLVAQAKLRHD